MTTLYQSLWATSQRNVPYAACAGDMVSELFEFDLPSTALAAGDIIELGVLPSFHSVTDATLVSDQLDTGEAAAVAFNVGLMSGDVGDTDPTRTCGDELFSAASVGQAGGIARATQVSAFTIAPIEAPRSVGVKVTAAAQTQSAGAKLRLMLTYRAF